MRALKIGLFTAFFVVALSVDPDTALSLKALFSPRESSAAAKKVPLAAEDIRNTKDAGAEYRDQLVRKTPQLEPCPDGYEYWKTVIAKVTAYEPSERCCPGTADGKTSIGHNAWKLDGCAVDPRAIPYGTMLYIPNVGYRDADDTGSSMRRSWNRSRTFHVDVRMTYFSEARNWGVKYLPVKLFVKKRAQ